MRDGDSSDLGWKNVGSGIRDKHPGSATLIRTNKKVMESDPKLLIQHPEIIFFFFPG
jgi:hypothetical protein